MTCGQIVRFWPRVSGVPLKQRNETLQAGLRKSPAESKRLLLDYLLARPPDEQVHVLPGEVDAGRRVVEVKYPAAFDRRVMRTKSSSTPLKKRPRPHIFGCNSSLTTTSRSSSWNVWILHSLQRNS